jgi:hypothetical protein
MECLPPGKFTDSGVSRLLGLGAEMATEGREMMLSGSACWMETIGEESDMGTRCQKCPPGILGGTDFSRPAERPSYIATVGFQKVEVELIIAP